MRKQADTIASIGTNVVVNIPLSQFDGRAVEEALDHKREVLITLAVFDRIDGLDTVRRAFGRREVLTSHWTVICQALRLLADAAGRLGVTSRAAELRALAERISSTPIANAA